MGGGALRKDARPWPWVARELSKGCMCLGEEEVVALSSSVKLVQRAGLGVRVPYPTLGIFHVPTAFVPADSVHASY
jgi:hypothetical protein